MNLGQTITAILILTVLAVSLLNPGGWVLALTIAFIILTVYAAIEFFPEYILVTNQGKNARKDKRRRRRSRGLNPFSRTSKRETRTDNTREVNNDE
ncbi:hypothetical protein [Natronosalvus halobius]|uniref:hypothetical protein n=1 Tax=Natronosalvus halobius TaxID=2953746 RepID=UPI0020A13897|nr:hypothetical protein [Natronosalvus halobius]USZ73791.1 hypothetical protein NGM15_18465 [Natronosalvus halobius]